MGIIDDNMRWYPEDELWQPEPWPKSKEENNAFSKNWVNCYSISKEEMLDRNIIRERITNFPIPCYELNRKEYRSNRNGDIISRTTKEVVAKMIK